MAKIKFDFSKSPLSAKEILDYYTHVVSAIECKYSQDGNKNYTTLEFNL